MIAREDFSIDDTLWTQAARVFHQRGTTVARAIQEFLQRAVEERVDTDDLRAAGEGGFPALWEAFLGGHNRCDMSLEEINDEIALSRTERAARNKVFPPPQTELLSGGSYLLCTPENYTLGWLRDFADSYNNASTAAMLALAQASQSAAEGGVAAMSLEEIDREVALYRTGG